MTWRKKNTHTQQLQIEVKRKIENGGVVRAKRLTMNGKNKSSFKVKLLSDLRKVTSWSLKQIERLGGEVFKSTFKMGNILDLTI